MPESSSYVPDPMDVSDTAAHSAPLLSGDTNAADTEPVHPQNVNIIKSPVHTMSDAPTYEHEPSQDQDISQSEDDEDAAGEEDDDFDLDAQAESDGPVSGPRSFAPHSVTPPGRSKSDEEEDFMLQNPELYGLRRSVRKPASYSTVTITDTCQGRAVTRQIVLSAPARHRCCTDAHRFTMPQTMTMMVLTPSSGGHVSV